MSSEPSRHRPLISKPWTPDDDMKLLEFLGQGKPAIFIAAKLRRTVGAIRTRKDRLTILATGTAKQAMKRAHDR